MQEDKNVYTVASDEASDEASGDVGQVNEVKKVFGIFTIPVQDKTERRLTNRQAQMLAMGGCIGTAYFLQMGSGLREGGPLFLLLSYLIWCVVVYGTNCVLSEMTVYLPVDSTWIVYVTRYVDESIGVANAWNFFFCECGLVCFEATAVGVIFQYWTDKIPTWVFIVIVLISYIVVEMFGVSTYGEIEFWLAIGKVTLVLVVLSYTFFSMVGANPERWVYGFHYWKHPGPLVDYLGDGGSSKSYFQGFLATLINASFIIAGPDYVSITAGEVRNPRKVMPKVFKTVLYRLGFFFIFGALATGIACPSSSPLLVGDGAGAATSPYVISMQILGVKGLPDLVNAVLITAVYASGNDFFYCATRTLFGLACEGKAPAIFKICLRNGSPIAALVAVAAIGCLALLQLGSGSQVVLSWFVSLSTASLLIYMTLINVAYLRFRAALKAQGIPYESLPYRHPLSGYLVYFSLIMNFIMTFMQGYVVFLPGKWDIPTFLFSYFMIFFVIIVFIGWKVVVEYPRTKRWFTPLAEVDLTTGKAAIDEYEANYIEEPEAKTAIGRFLSKLLF